MRLRLRACSSINSSMRLFLPFVLHLYSSTNIVLVRAARKWYRGNHLSTKKGKLNQQSHWNFLGMLQYYQQTGTVRALPESASLMRSGLATAASGIAFEWGWLMGGIEQMNGIGSYSSSLGCTVM